MKLTVTIGVLCAVAAVALNISDAIGGTCSDTGYACMNDADCLQYETCIGGGGGGGNTTCTNSSQCYDGYYCKFTSSSSVGTCTPYPDCSSGCTNCNTTSWGANGTGYETRTVATCDTTFCECSKKNEYRCASGYYGSTTNGTSGCSPCPTPGTSAAGAAVQTSCYIASGNTFSDTTGYGTYTGNCYYVN